MIKDVVKELGGSDIVRNLHFDQKMTLITMFIDGSEPRRW